MATYKAIPTVREDIEILKGNLRAADVQEVTAMWEGSVDDALVASYENAALCWTIIKKDTPIAVFGVGYGDKMGIPWMLGTDGVEGAALAIVRHSKEFVAQMLEQFDYLENYVDARNTLSLNWLKWCGFTIEPAEAYGKNGEMFHRFWMQKPMPIVELLHSMALDKATFRDKITALEQSVMATPGALVGNTEELCPLQHYFADGMYVRQITIPKGTLIIGKIHKHSHPNFLLKGDVTFATEDGVMRVQGPMGMISPAGTKRAVYAHEDTVWATVHATSETDLDKIEEEVIAKSFAEYDQLAIGRSL
jgi:hypothetical protein